MWSDRETEQDCLGYTSYVNVLGDLCIHKDLAPLTLGKRTTRWRSRR
jgi:hypothetical protein